MGVNVSERNDDDSRGTQLFVYALLLFFPEVQPLQQVVAACSRRHRPVRRQAGREKIQTTKTAHAHH